MTKDQHMSEKVESGLEVYGYTLENNSNSFTRRREDYWTAKAPILELVLKSDAERAFQLEMERHRTTLSQLEQAQRENDQLRSCLADARYRIEQGRVWSGMGWTLTGLSANGQQKALDAIDAAPKAVLSQQAEPCQAQNGTCPGDGVNECKKCPEQAEPAPAQDDEDYMPEGIAEAIMHSETMDIPSMAATALREQLTAPAQDERYVKGDTDAVGDCGKFEAGIHVDEWQHRIVAYGDTPEYAEQLRDKVLAALSRPAQTEQQQPVAWLPYLSDGADGVTGHYAIARKNPAGYREVWNLRRHRWAAFSDDVLTMDEALAILKKLEMPAAPIAQTDPAPVQGEREAEVPPMPETADRRPYDDDEPDGYLEGNRDWAEANNDAVEWLADNHRAIRAALSARPAQTEQQPEQSGLPLEPTEAMLDAYWEQTGESVEMRTRVHSRARKLYAAMARAAMSTTPSHAKRGDA